MAEKIFLNQGDIGMLAGVAAAELDHLIGKDQHHSVARIYAIPRGGIPAAYAIMRMMQCVSRLVDKPEDANVFIDDLLDSGETLRTFADAYPGRHFITLIDKQNDPDYTGKWVVFPWEVSLDQKADTIQDNIRRMMEFIGENPNREGLRDTPDRVAKAMEQWYSGYSVSDEQICEMLKVFKDGAKDCDEMVIVNDIPFFSHCEHHMAPFFGTATIAYIPDGKIVGLSKLPRLLDVYARRMQVQERLTNQVASSLMEHLNPLGVGVIITARHLCMESRGVRLSGTETTTIAVRGVFKDKPETRAEFMMVANK